MPQSQGCSLPSWEFRLADRVRKNSRWIEQNALSKRNLGLWQWRGSLAPWCSEKHLGKGCHFHMHYQVVYRDLEP